MRRKAREIFKNVKEEIRKHNVDLKITNGYRVWYDSEKCYGYFIPPGKRKKGELVVATGDKKHVDYLWDLAHELAHFRQWKREDPIFQKYERDDSFYHLLEKVTEKEAQKIFSRWGLKPSERLKRRSKKYLMTVS
jgi:hypothetical protein